MFLMCAHDTHNDAGRLPIHVAARSIHRLRDLTDADALRSGDATVYSKRGYTPLHYAAAAHSVKAIEFLYRRGAHHSRISVPDAGYVSAVSKWDSLDRTGWYPIHCTATPFTYNYSADHDHAYCSLRKADMKNALSALLYTARQGLDTQTESGLTCAWLAARSGCASALEVLSEMGADLTFSHR